MKRIHVRSNAGIGILLPETQKKLTFVFFIIVSISGVWWSILHDLVSSKQDDFMHDLLVIHGAGAFLSMMAIGAILPVHVRLAWKEKRNRSSGLMISLASAVIILSGFALYYGWEEILDLVKWIHLFVGVLAMFLLPIHIWIGRNRLGK